MITYQQELILIRGLPGSGKSTLAKQLASQGYKHFEADMYFTSDTGVYIYDPLKIQYAHRWCQVQVQNALKLGYSVVVANTFVKLWEMEVYIEYAINCKVRYAIITARGNWMDIHNVPYETIARMKDQWQDYPV